MRKGLKRISFLLVFLMVLSMMLPMSAVSAEGAICMEESIRGNMQPEKKMPNQALPRFTP